MSLKLSIIIPIYNVGEYLRECVNSVLIQEYDDFEAILIDDGSIDQCPAICDEYARADSRVRVIHTANRGLSEARNTGIREAKGDYFLFLDGDDYWISKGCLRWVSEAVRRLMPDVVVHPYVKIEGEKRRRTYPQRSFDSKKVDGRNMGDSLLFLVGQRLLISSACSKIVKRSLIEKAQLYFKPRILSEDVEWTGRLIIHAQSYGLLNRPFYAYRQRRPNSISATAGRKNIRDLAHSIQELAGAGEGIRDEKHRRAFLGYLAYEYSILLGLTLRMAGRERSEVDMGLASLAYLLDYGLNRRAKVVRWLYRILGQTLTARILAFYIECK